MIYRTKNSSKSFSWISSILCVNQQREACRLIVAGPNADKFISVFVTWCIRDDEQSHRTVRYQRFANTYSRNCISIASGYILKNALTKISRYLITAMPFFRLVDGDTWPSLYLVSQDCRYNHQLISRPGTRWIFVLKNDHSRVALTSFFAINGDWRYICTFMCNVSFNAWSSVICRKSCCWKLYWQQVTSQ